MPPTLLQTLGQAKITALVAFLQSQGGEITVSLSGEAVEETTVEASGEAARAGVVGTMAEEIFASAGCVACHQLDAIGAAGLVGPDLSQIGVRLTPHEIRQSILLPDTIIAETCPTGPCTPGVMPKVFGEQFSAIQLETLVAFLSNLGGPIAEGTGAGVADTELEADTAVAEPVAEEEAEVAEVVVPVEALDVETEVAEPEPAAEAPAAQPETSAATVSDAGSRFYVDPRLLFAGSVVVVLGITILGGAALAFFFARGSAAVALVEAEEKAKKPPKRPSQKKPPTKPSVEEG